MGGADRGPVCRLGRTEPHFDLRNFASSAGVQEEVLERTVTARPCAWSLESIYRYYSKVVTCGVTGDGDGGRDDDES